MSNRLVIARRELAALRREKTIVLAILTQLVVAAFSTFLLVGLVTVYSPGAAAATVPVEVGVTGNATGSVVAALRAEDISSSTYDSRQAAMAAFADGDLDAVVTATSRPAGNITVRIVVPDGELRATLTVARLKAALATLERERRAAMAERLEQQPLPVPDEVPGGRFVGFTYTVLVPLLILMPVFISGSIITDSLTEELARGTAELLRVTPLSPAAIVDGKALAGASLAPLQAGIWFLFLHLNGIAIDAPLLLLVMTTALAVVAVAIGALTALVAGERRGAQLLYAVLVLGAFGGMAVPGQNPVNAIARLAIGSAGTGTTLFVFALVGAGTLAYLGVRSQAARLLGE